VRACRSFSTLGVAKRVCATHENKIAAMHNSQASQSVIQKHLRSLLTFVCTVGHQFFGRERAHASRIFLTEKRATAPRDQLVMWPAKAHDNHIDDDSAYESLISRSPFHRSGSGVVGHAMGSANRQIAGSTDKLDSVAVRP